MKDKFAALALLIVGLMQMTGDLIGWRALKAVGAVTVASPALAQTDVATLTGHVAGAKAGAQVVATDDRTGQRSTGTGCCGAGVPDGRTGESGRHCRTRSPAHTPCTATRSVASPCSTPLRARA